MSVSDHPRIGTELLGYRIEALIGRGGMGVVYRAYDLRLKRNVALKLIAPELSQDERFRERFLAESEQAASLDHPNVIPIYNAGEHEGQLYLAMRYVEGRDLKTLLRENGALAPERAIAICSQVADALDAAHKRGLVHRDVKPSNVLLDEHEHVYLADFGLSRRLAEQAPGLDATLSLGTPAYVAPEQIQGDEVDERADVYSLGCLLHECLTGEAPYPRDSELAVLWAHLNDPPPQPPRLEAVMARALAKRPDERYATCGELVEAAREALGLTRARDRRPLALAALGLLVAAGALATGLVLTLENGGQATPKADLTVRNNSLVRIDPSASEIAAVTQVGRRAGLTAGTVSVAVGGETVWVHNWDALTASAIDSETGEVERTLSIGGSTPYVTANSIAADNDGAWVISQESGKGVLTRVRPGLELPREYTFDYDPLAVAVGEGSVWVAAKSVSGSVVLRIHRDTGSVLDTVTLRDAAVDPQTSFRDVQAISVGAGAVWVLHGGTIFRIDPATARISGRVDLPGNEAADVEAGDGAVWATVFAPPRGNVLARVDPKTLKVTRTIAAPIDYGSSLYSNVALTDGSVWWNGTDSGTIWRVEPSAGRVVSAIRLTPPVESYSVSQPLGIAASAGGVWVTVSLAP
jgi:tRNA A-37 threonylcarbamoyl transferase component Bud32/streptogramin lyase